MARIYAVLKRQVVTGTFLPGARLDPARLKDDLAASTMPIRDTLQRLTGEGLVENSHNEGFRVVQLNEAAVRDLYDWCRDLVHICLARADLLGDQPSDADGGADYAEEITKLLLRIAAASANHEHRRAMANLCERSFLLRRIEGQVADSPFDDLPPLRVALAEHDWALARDSFDQLHQKRIALLATIFARIRDRAVDDRSVIF
ncbi:GntR family transcriptional regulator [Sphingomonas oryzagri]